jgi:hypothetical protein
MQQKTLKVALKEVEDILISPPSSECDFFYRYVALINSHKNLESFSI